jgi:hypothetical protein
MHAQDLRQGDVKMVRCVVKERSRSFLGRRHHGLEAATAVKVERATAAEAVFGRPTGIVREEAPKIIRRARPEESR